MDRIFTEQQSGSVGFSVEGGQRVNLCDHRVEPIREAFKLRTDGGWIFADTQGNWVWAGIVQVDRHPFNDVRDLIAAGSNQQRLSRMLSADEQGGILRFDQIVRGQTGRTGIEDKSTISACIFGVQRQAVGGRARSIIQDIGRDAETQIIDFCLNCRKGVIGIDSDGFLERPVNRQVSGCTHEVQV